MDPDPHADPHDAEALRDFAQRERRPLAGLKADHWRDRKERLGAGEALRVAEALRQWCLGRQPGWPGPGEREADLAVHVRVGEALRSIGTPG